MGTLWANFGALPPHPCDSTLMHEVSATLQYKLLAEKGGLAIADVSITSICWHYQTMINEKRQTHFALLDPDDSTQLDIN
jgi:hypothetical protein